MSVSNKRGVPGIPTAALDAIKDDNVRQVLRAIVDGWNVRNGFAGTGDAAFITKSDLPSLSQTVIKNYIQGAGAGGGQFGGNGLKPGDIDRIVDSVEAGVFASKLWQDLGTRVQRIDTSVYAEQRARIEAVQSVADGLAAEAATRLGFDEVAGSKIASLENVTDTQAEQISGLTTRISGAESTIVNLQSTTATQAADLTALTTRVGDTESNITNLLTTTASQAQSLSSLTTRMDGAESGIATLNTTTASQANSISTLFTKAGNVEAAISDEATTRANADNAITTSVSTQFSQVNQSLAAIQTQQTTLSNSVASLSQTTTTLQSSLNSQSVALAAEAQTRANADGTLFGQYTVKVDVNGYVAGFGLANTAVNSTPFSDFIVRADRFAIGSPSGPGITPRAPFTVLTTADGNGNGPGVYITEAMIKKASITNAYIQNAAIDTLKIAGNSIFVSREYAFADAFVDTPFTYTNQLLVFDFNQNAAPVGGGFSAAVVCYFDNSNTEDSFGIVSLVLDGVEVAKQKFGVRSTSGNSKAIMPVMLSCNGISNGQNRIQMYAYRSSWRSDTGTEYSTFSLKNIKVFISASKR